MSCGPTPGKGTSRTSTRSTPQSTPARIVLPFAADESVFPQVSIDVLKLASPERPRVPLQCQLRPDVGRHVILQIAAWFRRCRLRGGLWIGRQLFSESPGRPAGAQ